MANEGRALITALNAGDYAAVDQYAGLSDHDIKIVNSHVHELFERAIKAENFKLFMALLKIPKVLVSGPDYCALRHAAGLGLGEYVRELARMPTANPNVVGKNGDTALLAAVKGGWTQKKGLDLVRAITILQPIKINIRDIEGRTALWYAMKKAWFDVATVLMDAGGNPKVEDEEGTSPLSLSLMASGLPTDLFTRMLGFTGDAVEEDADSAAPLHRPDDDDDSSFQRPDPFGQSVLQHPAKRTPSVTVQPKAIDDDDDQDDDAVAPPVIKQVNTVVQDFGSDDQVPVQQSRPTVEDREDFFQVMDGQHIDDSLEKSFLFSPSSDGRYRMHRKAVLEVFGQVMTQLQMTGEAITAADCARKDPASGMNLWQSAAVQGQFLDLLNAMVRGKRWPEAADLTARTADGRSLADLLDENAQLSQVLNDAVWAERPKHLAALLAVLPERRLRGMAPLVAKTNLLILHGGR